MSSLCPLETEIGDDNRMNTKIYFGVWLGSLVFLLPHMAYAWDEGYQGSWTPNRYGCCGGQEQSFGCGGYCAGQQDAQYDLQNNLQYQPQGQCLPCHSDYYWHNFHQGYDSYWNQHQEQNQGSSVNVNNSPGAYVSVNQYQTQNPLQQLARAACGILNCNQGGYQNGPN